MINKIIRVLRTPYSERYLLQNSASADFAALDLHYQSNGKIEGTLILFDTQKYTEGETSEILRRIDEELLPEVKIEEGRLSFTVS